MIGTCLHPKPFGWSQLTAPCEFCDIIDLYGWVPRAKTNAQMHEQETWTMPRLRRGDSERHRAGCDGRAVRFLNCLRPRGNAPTLSRLPAEKRLARLDELYRLGYRGHVDFVDDNLIDNKKAVKAFPR
jgi:hypothetical protein